MFKTTVIFFTNLNMVQKEYPNRTNLQAGAKNINIPILANPDKRLQLLFRLKLVLMKLFVKFKLKAGS